MDFTAEKAVLAAAGGGLLLIAFVVWIIKSGVKEGMRESRRPVPASPIQRPGGFPIQATVASDGPGRYRVEGVDKETRMDVTEHVEARSAANAKAKAELAGIVVTAVERVGN